MRAVAKVNPSKGFSLIEAEEPVIKEEDEVILEVIGASICGTDLHIYEWDEWASKRMKLPRIVGHEAVGRIIKKGKLVNLEEGDIVACESHIPCMNCYYCKTGRMHICENLKLLGFDVEGCFSEYYKTKAITLWKLGKHIKPEYASVLEPLGNAVHAISKVDPRGKEILVYGCGPIGMATIYFLKRLGALKIIAVDISSYRLKMAKNFGADVMINAKEEDPLERIKEESEGIDIFFEMSGAQEAFEKGLASLKRGALAVFFGIPSKKVYLDIAENIILKEIEIKSVFGRRMFETWYLMDNLIKRFNFPFEEFITHRFSLEEYEKAFETLKSGNCGKIMLKP